MRCSICDSSRIEEVERTGRILFRCSNGHERPTVEADDGKLETTKFDGERIHVNVAAVVFTGEEIIMVKRKKYPFLYSMPFRHLRSGENPEKAARDVVEGQAGLEPDGFDRFEDVVIGNRCWMRGDKHRWIFFKAETEKQMLRTCKITDEARWFDRKKIIQGLPVDDGTRHLYNHGYLNRLTII